MSKYIKFYVKTLTFGPLTKMQILSLCSGFSKTDS